MLKSLARRSVVIALAILMPIFLITLIHLNLGSDKSWLLWKFNWILVALVFPLGFIFLNIAAKKLIEKRPDTNRSRSEKNAIMMLTVLGNIAGGIVAIAMFLFLLIATGTKVGQLTIVKSTPQTLTAHDHLDLVDVRGEIHVHSSLSWDSDGKIEDIAAAAKKNGVRWIIFTDHIGQLPPGVHPDNIDGVHLIYGQERSHKIGGECCGSVFRASLKDPKRELQMYGHVEKFGASSEQRHDENWDAFELISFHANARSYIGSLLGKLLVIPEDFYPTLTITPQANLDLWLKKAQLQGKSLPIFAGPDAHQNMGALGMQTDPYEFIFKMISTHIWIEKSELLNQESIFRAIKLGRTYIAFDYLGDTIGFGFYADSIRGPKHYTSD